MLGLIVRSSLAAGAVDGWDRLRHGGAAATSKPLTGSTREAGDGRGRAPAHRRRRGRGDRGRGRRRGVLGRGPHDGREAGRGGTSTEVQRDRPGARRRRGRRRGRVRRRLTGTDGRRAGHESQAAPRRRAAGREPRSGRQAAGDSDSPGRIRQATPAQLEAAGLGELPLAPARKRVDLELPAFSDPTDVTNPLFPIAALRSAILPATSKGCPSGPRRRCCRHTRIVEWPEGRPVETLISQYVAFLDGRLEEVALDWYAQADDGSVWYFGEDVFNYEDGVVADTEGTWLAGREGPAAMIMPAEPAGRRRLPARECPGLVFEEVTIGDVGQTVDGPSGPVDGAIVAEELHLDGGSRSKTFAPGYGEFFDRRRRGRRGAGAGRADRRVAAGRCARRARDALRGRGRGDRGGAQTGGLEGRGRDARAGDGCVELGAGGGRSPADRAEMTLARGSHRERRGGAAAPRGAGCDRRRGTAGRPRPRARGHRPPAEIDVERFALRASQLAVHASARDATASRRRRRARVDPRPCRPRARRAREDGDRDAAAGPGPPVDARNLASAADHAARLAARMRHLTGQ